MGIQANVAIFTVGTVRDEALLFRLGYLNDTEKHSLKQKSVGDICSHFFDENGEICNRTMGIYIDALKQKEKSILVACGKLKLNAIRGALKAKIANILITDQCTAKELLK